MIELVWDQHQAGTAVSSSGRCLCVGEGAEFSPVDLLATAAAACLMRTFARLSAEAQVDVLSFAATAHVGTGASASSTRIFVHAQIVISDTVPEGRVLALWRAALLQSPVAGFLCDRLDAEADVTRLRTVPAAPE